MGYHPQGGLAISGCLKARSIGSAGGPICREAGSGLEQEFQQSGSTGQEGNEGSGRGGGSRCHAEWWSPSKLKGVDFSSVGAMQNGGLLPS